MRKLILITLIATWTAMAATPARADMMSYLSSISSSTIGTLGQPLALVNLHQNGANEVDVTVSLDANTKFVKTGTTGNHNAFAFSLNLSTPYTETIITSGFTAASGSVGNVPYGTFTNGIECPSCGPGASNAKPGPLEFKIVDLSGISIADFVSNGPSGFFFSADVIGPLGGSGNIASTELIPTPLPATLPLFGAGLMGLGLLSRRKTLRAA